VLPASLKLVSSVSVSYQHGSHSNAACSAVEPGGLFHAPTVKSQKLCAVYEIASACPVAAMQIFSEETFGPAVPLFKVSCANSQPATSPAVPLGWRSIYDKTLPQALQVVVHWIVL
jgi:hypothetical protein